MKKNLLTRIGAGFLALALTLGILAVPSKTEGFTVDSKKGLQGDYILTEQGVTGHHMLLNLYLDEIDSPDLSEKNYVVNGNSYYFKPEVLDAYQTRLKEAAERNIEVTLVLLLRGNAHCNAMGMMAAGGADPNRLYAMNPNSEALEAFFGIIAHELGSGEYGAANFILGNEVNMPNHYNYTGTLDPEKNAELYVRTFLRFSQMLRVEGDPRAKAYLSLDHSWTDNGAGSGIAGKTFLDLFAKKMAEYDPSCPWNVAYHLYAPDLSRTTSIWTDVTEEGADPLFISPANLTVLTDYIRENFGEDHRVILSEQGYSIAEGETAQAAALALCYEAAEQNDLVDAVIFRSFKDEGTDGGLDLGLLDAEGNAREAYMVYQEMDTTYGERLLSYYAHRMEWELEQPEEPEGPVEEAEATEETE